MRRKLIALALGVAAAVAVGAGLETAMAHPATGHVALRTPLVH
ncbi:hypothetical protein GCM10023196_003720 [Actinoallomurus vinaceus]|uniref:Uncharacterized protein n=1 Tax=Actinoallomurus vinaceus TaxID=1080074 RepID=A0ABP8TZH8_9ACTN